MEDKNTIAVEIIKKPKNLAEIFRIRPNLENYGKFCRRFKWQDIEKEFSWSKTGKVNMAHETIDRHAETWRKNKIALYYLDDERYEKYTFQEMKTLSDKFANVLKKYNIGKGERVVIFMPRSPEFYISLIGILKVGAIPVPLFEAFMKDALFDRMADCEACAVVTTSILQGRIPREKLPSLKYVFLADVNEANSGEISWKKEMGAVSGNFSMEWLQREDSLILHYTSGSTGKPKGIIHVQEAMLGQYLASKLVVDLHEEDIFWCTADPGWVTGTAVGFLGPWLLG